MTKCQTVKKSGVGDWLNEIISTVLRTFLNVNFNVHNVAWLMFKQYMFDLVPILTTYTPYFNAKLILLSRIPDF